MSKSDTSYYILKFPVIVLGKVKDVVANGDPNNMPAVYDGGEDNKPGNVLVRVGQASKLNNGNTSITIYKKSDENNCLIQFNKEFLEKSNLDTLVNYYDNHESSDDQEDMDKFYMYVTMIPCANQGTCKYNRCSFIHFLKTKIERSNNFIVDQSKVEPANKQVGTMGIVKVPGVKPTPRIDGLSYLEVLTRGGKSTGAAAAIASIPKSPSPKPNGLSSSTTSLGSWADHDRDDDDLSDLQPLSDDDVNKNINTGNNVAETDPAIIKAVKSTSTATTSTIETTNIVTTETDIKTTKSNGVAKTTVNDDSVAVTLLKLSDPKYREKVFAVSFYGLDHDFADTLRKLTKIFNKMCNSNDDMTPAEMESRSNEYGKLMKELIKASTELNDIHIKMRSLIKIHKQLDGS